jgi:hypothetical protein
MPPDIALRVGILENHVDTIKKDISNIEVKLSGLPDPEADIKIIKADLELIKKIVYGIVGLVLIAFVGQVINQTSEYQKLRTIIERLDNGQARATR